MLYPFLDFCKRLIVSPFPKILSHRSDGALFWKEKIFFSLSVAFVYLGFITVAISIIVSLAHRLLIVAVFDFLIYAIVVISVLSRQLTLQIKSLILVAVIYLTGIMILFMVGPFGAGLLWLFSFPVFAGILLGLKGCYVSLIINLITLILFTFAITLNWFPANSISAYKPDAWLVTAINFILINIGTTVSLTILFDEMKKYQDKQINIQNLLVEDHTKLAQARFEAEEHNMQISQFLANFSHELRSPMNAIIGFSSLMRNKTYPRVKQDLYFKIIEEKGQYLLQLINDVIDISKIESNQLSLTPEPCELYPLFDDLYIYFKEEIARVHKQHISIVLTVQEELKSVIISVDILRIKQILINFISNALKFTEKGYIEFGYYMIDAQTIRIFVKDSGIGLEPSEIDRIFLRYEQGNDLIKKNKEGIGLGLFITKNLVTMMNGKVRVESVPGKGSEFIVELPFEHVAL